MCAGYLITHHKSLFSNSLSTVNNLSTNKQLVILAQMLKRIMSQEDEQRSFSWVFLWIVFLLLYVLYNQCETSWCFLPCRTNGAQRLLLIMNSLFTASHTNDSRSHMLKVEKRPSLLRSSETSCMSSHHLCVPPLLSSTPTGKQIPAWKDTQSSLWFWCSALTVTFPSNATSSASEKTVMLWLQKKKPAVMADEFIMLLALVFMK